MEASSNEVLEQAKELIHKCCVQGKVVVDIGCGKKKRGIIGIDAVAHEGVDIVWDIEQGLPLPDSCADELIMSHVLEHVQNPLSLLNEARRVGKPGSLVKISVPHFSNPRAFEIHHKSYYNYFSFDPVCGTGKSLQANTLFQIRRRSIGFSSAPRFYLEPLKRIVAAFANRHPWSYELILHSFCPAYEVVFELSIIK